MGQKFCRNRFILLLSEINTCVFNAEIQEGRQKWRENEFCIIPIDSADILHVKNAEIQDDCQKWQENDFWENSAVDSAATLWVKILSKSLYLAPLSR